MRRSSCNIPPQRALHPEPPQEFAEEGQDGFDKAHQHFSASRRYSKQENVTNNSYWNIPTDRWKNREYPTQYNNANPHWSANSVGGHGVMQAERQYPDSTPSASSSYNYYGGYYDQQYQYQQYQQSANSGSGNMRTCDGNTGLGNPSSGAADHQRRQTRSAYDTALNTGSFAPRLMAVKREQDSEVLDAEGDNFGSIFTKSLTSLYSQDAENAYADQSDPDIIICDSVTNSEDASYQRLGPPNQYHNPNANRGNFGGYYDGNRPDGLQPAPMEDGNQMQLKSNPFRYDRPSFDDMHLYSASQSPVLTKSQQAKKRKMSMPNFPADGFAGGENRTKKQPKMLAFKSDSKWTPNSCSFSFSDVVIKEEPLDDYPCEEEPATTVRKPVKESVPSVKPPNNQEHPKTLPRKRSPGATCFDKFDKSSSKTSKKVSPISAYAKVQDSIVLSLKCRRYKKRTKAVVGKEDGYNDTDNWKRTGIEQAVRHVIGELLDRVSPCADRRISDLPEFPEIGIHRIRELLYQFCQRYALDYNDFEDIEKVMKPCMFTDKPETSERTKIRKRTSTSPIQTKQESVKTPKAVAKKANETPAEKRVLRKLPGREERGRQTRRRGGKVPTFRRRYSTRSAKDTDNEDAANSDAEIVIDSSSDRESFKEEDTKGTKKSKRMSNKANSDSPEKNAKNVKNDGKDDDLRKTKQKRNESTTEVSQKDNSKKQQRRKWARVSNKYSSDSSQSSLNDEVKNVVKKEEAPEKSRVSRSTEKMKTEEKTKVTLEKSDKIKASQVRGEENEKKIKVAEKTCPEKSVEKPEKSSEKSSTEKSVKKSCPEKSSEKSFQEKFRADQPAEKSDSRKSSENVVPEKSITEKSSSEKLPKRVCPEKPSEKSPSKVQSDKPHSEKPSEKSCFENPSEKLSSVTTSGKPCSIVPSEKPCLVNSSEKAFSGQHSDKAYLKGHPEKPCSEKLVESTSLVVTSAKCLVTPSEETYSEKSPETECIIKQYENTCLEKVSEKSWTNELPPKECLETPFNEMWSEKQHEKETLGKPPKKAWLESKTEKMYEDNVLPEKANFDNLSDIARLEMLAETACLERRAQTVFLEQPTEKLVLEKSSVKPYFEKSSERPCSDKTFDISHLDEPSGKISSDMISEKSYLKSLENPSEDPSRKRSLEKSTENSHKIDPFGSGSAEMSSKIFANSHSVENPSVEVPCETPHNTYPSENPQSKKTLGKFHALNASEHPSITQLAKLKQKNPSGEENTAETSFVISAVENSCETQLPKRHETLFETSGSNQHIEHKDKWKGYRSAQSHSQLKAKSQEYQSENHLSQLHPSVPLGATNNWFTHQIPDKGTAYKSISMGEGSSSFKTERTSDSSLNAQTSQLEKNHGLENPSIPHPELPRRSFVSETSSFERRSKSSGFSDRLKAFDNSGHPYKRNHHFREFPVLPTPSMPYDPTQAKAASGKYSNISPYYLGNPLLGVENDMFMLQNTGKVGVPLVQRPIPVYGSRPMLDAAADAPPFLRKMDIAEPRQLHSPNHHSRWKFPSEEGKATHSKDQSRSSAPTQKEEEFVRCTSAPAPMEPKRTDSTQDANTMEPLSLTVNKRQQDNKSAEPPHLGPNVGHGSRDEASFQAEQFRYFERPHSIPSDYLYKTDFSSTLSGIKKTEITNVLFNSISSFGTFEKGAFETVSIPKQLIDGSRASSSSSRDDIDSRKLSDAAQGTSTETTKNDEPIYLGKPPELMLMTNIKKECIDDFKSGDTSRQRSPNRSSKDGDSSSSRNSERRKSLSKRKDSKNGDRVTFSESDDSDGELVIDLDRGQMTSEDRNPANSPKPSTSHADPQDLFSLKKEHGGGCSHWEDDDDCVILNCGSSDKSRSEKSAKDTNESILRTLLLERGELMNTSSSSQDVACPQSQQDDHSNSLPEIDYAAAANQEVLKLISELRNDGSSCSSSAGLSDSRRVGEKLSPCYSSNGDSLVVTEESLDCSNLDPQRLLKVLIMKLNYEICLLHCLAEQKEQERSALMSYKRDKERILERLLKQYFLNVQDDVHDDLQDHVRDWILSRHENTERNSSSKESPPAFRLPPSESQGAPHQQRPSNSQSTPTTSKGEQPSTSNSPSLPQPCWGEKLPTVETLIAKATENYGVDMRNIQSSSSATATTNTTATTTTADQNILMKVLLANENTSNLPSTVSETTSKLSNPQPSKPAQKAHSKQYGPTEQLPQTSNRSSKDAFNSKAIPKLYDANVTNVPYDYSTSSENRGKSKPYDIPKLLASCEYTPHFDNRASGKHYDTSKPNSKYDHPANYDNRTVSKSYNSSKSYDYKQSYDQRTASKPYVFNTIMPCEFPPGFDSRTSTSTNFETSDTSATSGYFSSGYDNSRNGHHQSSSMKSGDYDAKEHMKHASPTNSAYWSIQAGSKASRGDNRRVDAVKREHTSPPLNQSESSSKKRLSKHAFSHPSKMSSGVSVKSEPSHQRSLKSSVERIYNRKSEEERRALAYSPAALPTAKGEGAYGVLPLAPPGQMPVPKQMRPMASPRCMSCGTIDAKFVCSGCGKHWYCSTRCQTLRWPEHSHNCSGLANSKPLQP